jgi:hypothetical protein
MKHILILITALLAACNPPENPNAPPFRPAVEAHLAALKAHDMEALLPTLTSGNSLLMMDDNGIRSETLQEYLEYQRRWFADNIGSTIEPEILDVMETFAFGHALVRYRYTVPGAAGQAQTLESWLTLTFDLENGSWRLTMRSETLHDPRKHQEPLH